MKRLSLLIIPALICGVMCCSTADVEDPEIVVEPSGELYVVGAKSSTDPTDPADKTDLVFTGDDIVSFNISSGEIVFSESTVDDIISRVSLHSELHFFIDEIPVFSPPVKIHFGWGVSFDDFDLQFRTDGVKIYLTEVYMNVDSLPEIERALKEIEFEANKQKRQTELDVLIKYLNDAGKISDVDAISELPPLFVEPIEPQPEVNDSLNFALQLYSGVYYIVGYDANCGVEIHGENAKARVYVLVSEEKTDTYLAVNNLPDEIFNFPANIMINHGIFGFNFFPQEYRFAYKVQIDYRPMTGEETKETFCIGNARDPVMFHIEPAYVVITSITKTP